MSWWRRIFTRPRITLVCMRLENMRLVHPAQVVRVCHRCSAPVGIYPSGQAAMRRYGSRVDVVCEVCNGPVGHAVLVPGALAERGQSVPR